MPVPPAASLPGDPPFIPRRAAFLGSLALRVGERCDMKKTCKIVGRDGKGNGRAMRANRVSEALKDYLEGNDSPVWSFALGLCRDADEAGELVQEACYRALKASASYKAETPVKSWLFSILRNAFLDSRRRMERRKGVSLDHRDAEEDGLFAVLASGEESVLSRLVREEHASLARRVVSRLGRGERAVLTLCVERGLTNDAAAKRLGIPPGTVRSRLSRARIKLRKVALTLDLD